MTGDGLRAVLLGTGGGPTPKSQRAYPSQAVVVAEDAYVVDCGNGVARQLELAGISVGSLRCVFVTHHHSDHNADIGTLPLLAWGAIRRPIDVFGPPPLRAMIEEFLQLHRVDIAIRTADEGRPRLAGMLRVHEVTECGAVYEDRNIRVSATLVNHPPFDVALGYRLDGRERSVVVSGDTTPSLNVARLAAGAEVLIHEAIYMPAVAEIAAGTNGSRMVEHLMSSHTSVQDAGRVASEAGVKTLVLSHLVPGGWGLSDEIWRDAAAETFGGRIVVGRDLLDV